jgi:glycosyltransferase involved in cell wall biosynthesis
MNHPSLLERREASARGSEVEQLVVVIPCFNEEGTLRETVGSVRDVAPHLDLRTTILLMDDGSTDGTREVMAEMCDEHESCRMHVSDRNQGLGRTVMKAYELIESGRWVTVIPGDNEFIFSSIKNHLAVRAEHDIVLGFLQNAVVRTVRRRVGSTVFQRTVGFLYGFPYRYLNGLKLYRSDAFKGLDIVSSGHAFNAELLAKALLRDPTLRIGEAPFLARGRSEGHSKAFQPRSVARAVWDVYRGFRSVTGYRKRLLAAQARQLRDSSAPTASGSLRGDP